MANNPNPVSKRSQEESLYAFKGALKESVIDRLLLLVVMGLMLSLLWCDAHSPWAFTHRPGYVYDNYYIAINAKNISEGKGWGLSNGNEFVRFDREISSGPIVFLPVVAAIKFISDRDNARYLGVIFLNLFLTGLLLHRLKFIFPQFVYRAIWVITPFVLLAFMREQWYLVLGEVPASLLLLISASYVGEKNISYKQLILSGLYSGMALMSKLLAILSVPWIVATLCFALIYQQGLYITARKLLAWILGFCVVPGMVAAWHLIGLQGSISKLADYASDYLGYYFGFGGSGSICSDIYYCLQLNFQSATESWVNGEGVLLETVSLVFVGLAAGLVFKKKKTSADILLIVMSGMCVTQFLFFYVDGIHRYPRYYFIGGFISLFGLCLFAVGYLLPWIKHNIARLTLFFVLLTSSVYYSLPLYREKGFDPFHADTREVADYINHNDTINELLWSGFGLEPFPIASYYFDADKNWLKLYGFALANLTYSSEKLQPDADFYWKNYHNFYYLDQSDDTSKSPGICALEKFRNHSYRVLECNPSELEAFFARVSGGKMRFPKPTTQVN